ncbi:hypothetical protein M758_10G096900 [Ceratodon purpureus]|nr:hypothetical protein M758_10G096900 [Ceratodon purpureus]
MACRVPCPKGRRPDGPRDVLNDGLLYEDVVVLPRREGRERQRERRGGDEADETERERERRERREKRENRGEKPCVALFFSWRWREPAAVRVRPPRLHTALRLPAPGLSPCHIFSPLPGLVFFSVFRSL